MSLSVSLVTPERKLWAGEAKAVTTRTVEGEIGILEGHVPVMSLLAPGGVVRIDLAEGALVVAAVHGGFVSVSDNTVMILAEVAELAHEIDAARAQEALDRARSEESAAATAAAHRAEARLRAVAGVSATH